MAQTIATKTGSISVNFSTPAFTTVFTQSSGTARVILNSLECSTNNVGTSLNGWFYLGNSALGNKTPIFPMNAGTGSTNVGLLPGFSYGGVGTTLSVSTQDSGIGFANIAVNGTSITTNQYCFCPRDFYMSSGDTLYIRGLWGSASGLCIYNFTTITET